MASTYGSKRLVVGAHYGLRDWLAQRITSLLMALFTIVVVVSMLWHVWVGMRDIWMDYVQSMGVRLGLQVLTIAWLVGCAGWAVQVLWRL